MEAACIRHTAIPHTTALFADFLYRFDRVAYFFGAASGADGFAQSAAGIDYPAERRAALVEALRELNGDSAELERLAQPGTFAVVTGQQVGLFTGPSYTIYKALTAAKLARSLTAAGLSSVAVFWLATEDHDAAEVDHCWAFDAGQNPVRLGMELEAAGRPVGTIEIGEPPLAQLRAALDGFPHGEQVAGLVEECYRPGRSLGEAFRRLLQRLLGGYGLVFADPLRPSFRRLAAPLLARSLRLAPELVRLLVERSKALEAAGYHAQVRVEPSSSLHFLLDGDRRVPLRRSETGYRAGDRNLGAEELAPAAERLSPNALLRPVMQDYVLPTIAYIGGPAEIAYLAQAQVLYQALIGRMPVVVSRSGFTLLDARARKLLGRYGLSPTDVFQGEQALREKIARRLIPAELEGLFRSARAVVEAEAGRLGQALARFDATLVAALEKSRAKMLYQLEKIERKTAREALRRSARAAAEAEYLANLLYPHNHLQERFYSILPFLARHGLDLVDRIYEAVNLGCPDHVALAL
jgi:bacillithiol biosynthesis cysteine-adding enzyme BshC